LDGFGFGIRDRLDGWKFIAMAIYNFLNFVTVNDGVIWVREGRLIRNFKFGNSLNVDFNYMAAVNSQCANKRFISCEAVIDFDIMIGPHLGLVVRLVWLVHPIRNLPIFQVGERLVLCKASIDRMIVRDGRFP
jgi:hypothetical protein